MKKINALSFCFLFFLSLSLSAQKVIFFKEKNILLDSITSFSSIDFKTKPGQIYNPLTDTSSDLTILAEKALLKEVGFWKNMSDHGHMHEGKGMMGVKTGIVNGGDLLIQPKAAKKLKYPTTLYVYVDIIQDDRVIFRGIADFNSLNSNQKNEQKIDALIRAIFAKFISK